MNKLKTFTSMQTFDKFWRLTDGSKKAFRIPREELERLLIDHSRMINELLDRGIEVDGYTRIHIQEERIPKIKREEL